MSIEQQRKKEQSAASPEPEKGPDSVAAAPSRRASGDLADRHRRRAPSPIQGQLLRLSERREVAIFLCDGELWIADFVDGDGELIDAVTWFQFHCAALSTADARHRMILESGIPLSDELVARIEILKDRNRDSM
jgi:hypothetical protein